MPKSNGLGTLFLLPNVLSEEGDHTVFLPAYVSQVVSRIDGLIAESEKGARRFLRRFSFPSPKTFRDIPVALLNEHTIQSNAEELMHPLLRGETWGLISDCGLPCLADPGAWLVKRLRERNVGIEVVSGPSAIIFALLLSGLPAQSFSFHGYLPKEELMLRKKIQALESRSKEEKATQLFIEAPYRTEKLLRFLLATLQETTELALCCDLTLPTQSIVCQKVAAWKKQPLPSLDKRPAVFLFYA
ncbi:MAG: SAM-dependent methyltransferase [Anaerolineae bacterium]